MPKTIFSWISALSLSAALLSAGCLGTAKLKRMVKEQPTDPMSAPTGVAFLPKSVSLVQVEMIGGKRMFCSSGELLQIKVKLTLRDSSQIETWELTEDKETKVDFSSFDWKVSAGEVDEDGIFHPPSDPLLLVDKDISIRAIVKGNESAYGETYVSPVYDCGASAFFNGEHGAHGNKGNKGLAGNNGRQGNNEQVPLPGYDGTSGGDAEDGLPGKNAPALEVGIAYIKSQKYGKLILARVINKDTNQNNYYLIDPATPTLRVYANGGDGGAGGPGGNGGLGGYGGSDYSAQGRPGASGGNGGDGGSGANGAAGGNGGSVVVYYDKAHPELKDFVYIENSAGAGGEKGKAGMPGLGGPGGTSQKNVTGSKGEDGKAGKPGQKDGKPGKKGPPPKFIASPASEIFAAELGKISVSD